MLNDYNTRFYRVLGSILVAAGLFVFAFLGWYHQTEVAVGAPEAPLTRSLVPETDSLYYVGTNTSQYAGGHFDELCLSADCKTVWPSGSGASFGQGWDTYTVGGSLYLRPTTTITTLHNNGFVSAASSTVNSTLTLTDALFSRGTATSTFAAGLRLTGGLSTTQGIEAPFYNATSTTATSTFVGPIQIGNTAGSNLLAITASGSYGTASLVAGDGLLNVGNTNNNDVGLQVYTNNTSNQYDPLVVFRADNTDFDEGVLYVLQDGTAGGAFNIRMDGPAPQIEWVETDQTTPAGKFETLVNGDIFRIASRNAGDTGFEDAFHFNRLQNGGAFHILGTATSTSAGGQRITGGLSTTQGIEAPFYNATSTSAASSIDYRLGIGTTTPWAKFAITNTTAAPTLVVTDEENDETPPLFIDTNGKVVFGSYNSSAIGNSIVEFFSSGDNASLVRLRTAAGQTGFVLDTNSGANSDWLLQNNYGHFLFSDTSNNVDMLELKGDSHNMLLVHGENAGNLGIATSSPQSLVDIAGKGDGTRSYLQIDSEAGAPPAGDCDSLNETGRMIIDHTNDVL